MQASWRSEPIGLSLCEYQPISIGSISLKTRLSNDDVIFIKTELSWNNTFLDEILI